MHLVKTSSEVAGAVSRVKATASGYSSNLFVSPRRLQDWISHGELFCKPTDGAVLFLRKDRDFWHLYYCATSPTALALAIPALGLLKTEPTVLDLIGQESELVGLAGLFQGFGFRSYNRLLRMVRAESPATLQVAPAADPRVALARLDDCQSILDMLLSSFDPRVEQIPMLHEIEAAVEFGQIWIARGEGDLAGLLFFETQGLTSTLRYWLIAPEFRSQRFGSGLMRRYLAGHPAVRRFLLWVIADNANAIAKYEHYDFTPDGLVDQVMANEMIRP